MKRIKQALAILLVSGLAACALQNQQPDIRNFYPISYQTLSGWESEDFVQLMKIFRQNCQTLFQFPPNTQLGGASNLYGGRVRDWYPACQVAINLKTNQPQVDRQFFETWLQPYQYSAISQTVKVTGYYEPEIAGSEVRGGAYQIPVYGRPPELMSHIIARGEVQNGFLYQGQFIPYYTRAQINNGALADRHLELAWLSDPADLFFMQIQGSGRIILPNGKVIRLAYAGKNGQPYVPLGRIMINQGLIEPDAVNIYSLRRWLQQHPTQAQTLMNQNPNYVFFRKIEDFNINQGPIGAFGNALFTGRSVAVDRNWIPLGVPLWMETTLPTPPNAARRTWNHMVFAQDLGGDIKGIHHVDLFTGWGKTAEWYAGLMNEKGLLFIMLPRYVKTTPLMTPKASSAISLSNEGK